LLLFMLITTMITAQIADTMPEVAMINWKKSFHSIITTTPFLGAGLTAYRFRYALYLILYRKKHSLSTKKLCTERRPRRSAI
jgi:hypothetical protein